MHAHAEFDEKLHANREWLMARDAQLRERIVRVHEDLRRSAAPLPRDAPDAAIIIENDEILEAIEQSAHAELRQIAHALGRLDAGAFAKCEKCAAKIDDERLRVVPYATCCRRCAST